MERFLPLAYERLKGKGGRAPLFPIFTEITTRVVTGHLVHDDEYIFIPHAI